MSRRPFESPPEYLRDHLEELVDATFADLGSEFLLLPQGEGFIKYTDFRDAYEVLKRHTHGFSDFSKARIYDALRENSRVLGVVRAMLGMTPPEWADLARAELGSDVTQGAARSLDRRCRSSSGFIRQVEARHLARVQRSTNEVPEPVSLSRIDSLLEVAVRFITNGAPDGIEGVIHRLDKFDTAEGLASAEYAARHDAPYAVLLYERFLGRPFAGHRDAVSGIIGEVMENAIEEKLRAAGISYRKTKRAERIPGFGQAPDFCVPDEVEPAVVIEAKITSDDGTARDKVTRIKNLVTQRDTHLAAGKARYEVVACIDGRGFRVRREDMRQLLLKLDGKVFTTATLDRLVTETNLRDFVSRG